MLEVSMMVVIMALLVLVLGGWVKSALDKLDRLAHDPDVDRPPTDRPTGRPA